MIELEVLALLKGCKELTDLLGGSKIYPYDTEEINSMFYKVVPLTSNGTKETYRLELTSIMEDDYKALQIREILKKLLITVGDTPLTSTILKVVQNGGSTPIFNAQTQTFNTKINFEMIRRA